MNTNDCNIWLLLAIFVVGTVAVIGFFFKMQRGFGKFNTSTLLLLLVVIITGLFFAADKFQPEIMANITFAIIGFAGGLFTAKTKDAGGNKTGKDLNTPRLD
jgi:uncharacterized membrane protein YoaK (UPF0700 family)